ncbi:hypothetical protein BH09PSE2_BH09PSE2_01640 [soil metagenome]
MSRSLVPSKPPTDLALKVGLGAAVGLAVGAAGFAAAKHVGAGKSKSGGLPHEVKKAVTIQKSRDELYAFWRHLPNLSRVMENIDSVVELDAVRSHWVVQAPAGRVVEWDAVITDDQPGRRIAWETEPGAMVKSAGSVEFEDGPVGRGTVVRAHFAYDPPAGELGKVIATLFQMEPGMQAHRDLRRVKMLMETGEIATTKYPDAAPRFKKSDAAHTAA